MRSFHARCCALLFSFALTLAGTNASAQCTWYTITVTDGNGAPDVTWELIDQFGVTWTSGAAPWQEDICLPDGCYTLLMFDSGGDGWDDIDFFIEDWTGDFVWDTNLPNGPHGTDGFALGDGTICGNPGCAPGTTPMQLIITGGTQPAQVSWNVTLNGTVLLTGGAPFNDTLCLDTACYQIHLFDAANNGWNGANYTLKYFGGPTLYTGTLASGGLDSALWVMWGADCTTQPGGGQGGGGGGGGGGGSPCGNSGLPTGDCATVVCACDPFTFPITPSGFGNFDEVPGAGSISNPAFGGLSPAPWGGTDYGCLLGGELNSSWMLITIGTSGNLGFSFGAGGQQVGYYDWAMWPYTGGGTCNGIINDALPPARCVWNAVPYGGTGLASTIPPGGDPGNYAPLLPVLAGQQYIICMSNYSFVNTNVTLDFFGTATVQCGFVLPIELVAFAGACEGAEVVLRWNTASELNNDHFTIERSVDGQRWAALGTVLGAGTTQQSSYYAYTDREVLDPLVYYRLQQTDRDGTSTTSDMVAVRTCGSKDVVRQWLVDASGRACGAWPAEPGSLATGIYLVRTEFADRSISTTKVSVLLQ